MITDALGPRGGKVRADVSCPTCITFDTCRPGACQWRWGCSDWVNINGHRAIIPTIEAEPDIAGQIELF
jgi:hypothetical protein